jgi:AcrR family transcriptional regulator
MVLAPPLSNCANVIPAMKSDKPATAAPRRRYNSPVRRQQSTDTLELILTTGIDLMHGALEWDIARLNARTIAEHAGISMRTVQRYFPDERNLRDAVMQRSVDKSGISLEKLKLEKFSKTADQMFRYLASLPVAPQATAPVKDPTYAVMDQQRRNAVLNAVALATPDWSDTERNVVAGLLDILWSIPSYERLATSWELDADNAIRGLTWLIDLVNQAIKDGSKPKLKI